MADETLDPARLFRWLTDVHRQWGMTQKDFADACQISPNGMRGWNKGSHPTASHLATTANFLGVHVETLERVMRGEDVPIPPKVRPVRPNGTVEQADTATELARIRERLEALTDLILRRL